MSKLVYIVMEEDSDDVESVHFSLSDANQAIRDLETEYNGQYIFRTAPLLGCGERHDVTEKRRSDTVEKVSGE